MQYAASARTKTVLVKYTAAKKIKVQGHTDREYLTDKNISTGSAQEAMSE
jgi:hypothetical protein